MTDTDLLQPKPCGARMSVLSEARKSVAAQTCKQSKSSQVRGPQPDKGAVHFCVVQVRLLLLAALAQEHVLYIGPPGTAKSELGRRLSRLCKGTFFERLLTRFSVPEVGY